MPNPFRWRQRFQNYRSSLRFLEAACAKSDLSDLERAGLIQLFEVTFELGWKTLKDYLEYGGFDLKSPRDVLKQAFASGLLEDGEGWILALDGRNRFAHIYHEGIIRQSVEDITGRYRALLMALEETLSRLAAPDA